MTSSKTRAMGLALAVSVGMAIGTPANAGDAAFDASKEVVLPAAAVEYVNINEAIQFGSAWGDRAAEGHGTFGKFPANFLTPMHTHGHGYHAIVLAGTMTNPFEGETSPPAMGPGSYWFVPANAVHATACVSDTPCQFYFHSGGAFDFTPTEQ
jgi:hypothetical protein